MREGMLIQLLFNYTAYENFEEELTRKEATEHMQFVRDLLYPGWRQIYGL